jgi:hypothetical protein
MFALVVPFHIVSPLPLIPTPRQDDFDVFDLKSLHFILLDAAQFYKYLNAAQLFINNINLLYQIQYHQL